MSSVAMRVSRPNRATSDEDQLVRAKAIVCDQQAHRAQRQLRGLGWKNIVTIEIHRDPADKGSPP